MANKIMNQLKLFKETAPVDETDFSVKAEGAIVYDPRDKKYKTSNNPALILRDIYMKNHDGSIRTMELVDEYICKQADIADQYLFIPDGKGSYIAF